MLAPAPSSSRYLLRRLPASLRQPPLPDTCPRPLKPAVISAAGLAPPIVGAAAVRGPVGRRSRPNDRKERSRKSERKAAGRGRRKRMVWKERTKEMIGQHEVLIGPTSIVQLPSPPFPQPPPSQRRIVTGPALRRRTTVDRSTACSKPLANDGRYFRSWS